MRCVPATCGLRTTCHPPHLDHAAHSPQPVIYGKALNLHPAVVLLSLAAGGALFGITGTIAVPVVAVTVNVIQEIRSDGVETPPEMT